MSTLISRDLLDALLSPDGARRRAGEEHYQGLGLEARVEGLLAFLQQNNNTSEQHLLQLTAVLLRREIVQIANVRQLQELVTPLLSLQTQHRGSSIADHCLAEICASLQFLDATLGVEAVRSILQTCPTAVSLWIAVAQRAPESYAASRVWLKFPGATETATTAAAVENLSLIVSSAVAVSSADAVLGLQPHLASVLSRLPANRKDHKVWELLLQASEEVPLLLDGTMLEPMLQLCSTDASLPSVQVLVNLLHNCSAAVTNIPMDGILSNALSTCWNELEEIDDDDDDDDGQHHAQVLLSELLRFPGAMQMLQPEIEKAIHNNDPRRALLALQACVEGAPVTFQEHLGIATQVALGNTLREEYQSIRLLGLICDVGLDTLQEQLILEALARAAGSSDSRVALLACQSLVSYCRPSNSTAERSHAPFLADILQSLSNGPLQSTVSEVQVAAVGVVACWAETAGEAFTPFYAGTVPMLLQMAQSQNEDLSCASLEAVTIIGQAVPDLFAADAHRIMEWIVPLIDQKPSMLPSCARIANVLGESYVPYLSRVVPVLLQRVSTTDDIKLSEGNFQSLGWNSGGDEATVAIPGQGLTRVTLNTTSIQEKVQVIRSLYEHAVALGSDFGPYAPSCLEVLVPLIPFQFSVDVRGTAAQTVGAVFEALCDHCENEGNWEKPQHRLPTLLGAISQQLLKEDPMDLENLYAIADALSDTSRMMYCYGPAHEELIGRVAQTDVESVVQTCIKCLVMCLKRRSAITKSIRASLSEDESFELSNTLKEEENLLTPLVDTVGYILKTYRESFMPVFRTYVVPVLGPLLSTSEDIRALVSSVCLFDDCVEFCGGEAAATYSPMLLRGIQTGLDDKLNNGDDDLKAAALYGVAQIARYAPRDVLNPVAQGLVQVLASIASLPKQETTGRVLENAVSALASLVLFENSPFVGSGFVKRETATGLFLKSLPLSEDEDEAKICHAGLCDLLERGTINVDRHTIAEVVRGILNLVENGEQVASGETCARLRSISDQCANAGYAVNRSSGTPNIVSP